MGVSNNPDSEKEKEVEGHDINGTERGSNIISQQCGSNNVLKPSLNVLAPATLSCTCNLFQSESFLTRETVKQRTI